MRTMRCFPICPEFSVLHDPIDLFNLLLDLVLIAIGIWLAWNAAATQLRGKLGNAMRMIAAGALILGVAHLTETVLDQRFGLPSELNELTHRFFILVGFLSIGMGMSRITAAIVRSSKARQG
ncbi:MAG: hypothetical protein KF871_12640 [Hydrogenophaga sp.]|uniref:hypothetical protein n=1 Tax=Hydrogenophaga sp. TaxID=1904254 RepID=UPI001D576AED|nr:hypothetical protein [Hydrogenophaga sp.]MBX3610734.1 hypothetical protein [Hydrogenophaga sp.]